MTLLDNRTWAKQGIAEEFDYIGHSQAWKHPQVNVFVTLVLFIVMKVGGKTCEKMLGFEIDNLGQLMSVNTYKIIYLSPSPAVTFN